MKCALCGHEFKYGEWILTHFIQIHPGDLDALVITRDFVTTIMKYFVIDKPE
jgi:hypothetical protein